MKNTRKFNLFLGKLVFMGRVPEVAQKVFDKYEQVNQNNLDERIQLLKKFLFLIQDTKGNDRIIAVNENLLNSLKQMRENREKFQKKKASSSSAADPFSVKKGEKIQATLISKYFDPGVGKTTLLRNLTGAGENAVGYFTSKPIVGVYHYDNIPFLIVDTPSLQDGASQGVGDGTKVFSLARQSDLICLCIDLSRDPLLQMEFLLKEFNDTNIRLNTKKPPIEIERTGANNIQIFFMNKEAKESIDLHDDICEFCRVAGIKNAKIKVWDTLTLPQLTDTLNKSITYLPAIIIATKGDTKVSKQNFLKLMKVYGIPLTQKNVSEYVGSPVKFHIYPISISYENGKEKRNEITSFGRLICDNLNILRIYTKNRSGEIAEAPLIFLKSEVTIADVALNIHKSMLENFRYAVLYRQGEKIPKKRVGLDFIVKDGDIIEIYAKD